MNTHCTVALALIALTTVPAAASAGESCPDRIRDVVLSTFESGPYELRTELQSAMGTFSTVAEIVPDEGMHTHTRIGDWTSEGLLRDGRFYRPTDTGWREVPSETGEMFEDAMVSSLVEDLQSMVRPRCLGRVEEDGHEYDVYAFGADLSGIVSDTTIHVDVATGYTVRTRTEMMVGDQVSEMLADYRHDASITLPDPTVTR